MSIKSKIVKGYLLDPKSTKIVVEALVRLSLISPRFTNKQPEIKGSLLIEGFKPGFNGNQYILKFNDKVSGRVVLKVQPRSSLDMDLIDTRCDIYFGGDSFWYSSIEWFESL